MFHTYSIPIFAGVATSLVILIALFVVDQREIRRHQQGTRAATLEHLTSLRGAAESAANKRLYLVLWMKSQVALNPDMTHEEFAASADLIMKEAGDVRSVSLIKDNVISDVFPYEANKKAIGLDLLQEPAQAAAVRRAIQTRTAQLAGPIDLKQGGTAFVNRAPVFLKPESLGEKEAYWGLVSILIDRDSLINEIVAGKPAHLQVAIRGKDAQGAKGDFFLGSDEIYQHDPVELSITLPDGSWRAMAVPQGGWPTSSPFSAQLRLVGCLVALFGGMLIYWLVRSIFELKAAREAAVEASRTKSQFLANMSHEIRTPLNAVIGLSEAVLRTEIHETNREHLSIVVDSGRSLLTIINDILDLSKIEAGKLDIENTQFRLDDLIGDILRTMAVRAEGKGVELVGFVDPALPELVSGDSTRVRQILTNLLSNAIKFTEQGEVVLRVEPVEGQAGEVHFSVRDTGIGIEPSQIDRLFESFEQADSSTTREFGGTGLGLSISKQLVELMRGKIEVESEPGVGSKFSFSLPLQSINAKQAISRVDENGKAVLIFSASDTQRAALVDLTQAWGWVTIATASYEDGVAAIDDSRVQAVISDTRNSSQGERLLQELAGDPKCSDIFKVALTPVLVTSGAFADGIADACLSTPDRQSKLRSLLDQVAKNQTLKRVAVASQASASPTHDSLRILLVEDSATNQLVARLLLEEEGHGVTIANNGREGVQIHQSDDFDLILMDIEMPILDGFGATQEIRQLKDEGKSSIPIVAMSAHAMDEMRQRCLSAGMDGFVSKPIERDELLGALNLASVDA